MSGATPAISGLYRLPIGGDGAAVLARGLIERLGDAPPEALARVEIWLNTRRAARRLTEQLAPPGGPPRLLPRIRLIPDLMRDPALALEPPMPIEPLRRRLLLARLVRALIEGAPGLAPAASAFDIADALAALLDELQMAGTDPAAIAALDLGEHAQHWQHSRAFLDILVEAWPALRAEAASGAPDPEVQQRRAVAALAASWQAAPPDHPVIVAGSTGSRATTRQLMQAVLDLPSGALVLPGLDPDLPAGVWEQLGPDHPQSALAQVLVATAADPAAIAPWCPTAEPPSEPRNRLISLALRPAPVTDQWLEEAPARAVEVGQATARMTLLTAPTAREEAAAIAWRLRTAAEDGQQAALVTPDRTLARRVTAALARWRIVPDDSAGRPLGQTPPGVFLRLVATAIGRPAEAATLLALLKHPLAGGVGEVRGRHLGHLRRFERDILRGRAPQIAWRSVEAWAAKDAARLPWAEHLAAALSPLEHLGRASLTDMAAHHRAAAEALSRGLGPDLPLWDKAAGEEAERLLANLAEVSDAAGPLTPVDYRALLETMLADRQVRQEAFRPHPGIAILGLLEARMQSADLVILAGLNDGIWPVMPAADPWLSRTMRSALALPPAEQQIGLSAHDFQQASAAAEVVLSRSLRDDDGPTVASRWLVRLENLIGGLGPEGAAALEEMQARGARLLAEAVALERPAERIAAAGRPAPRPPAAARPRALSVTAVETLIRDPYAIYARHILGLRPLPSPGRQADPLARGEALHRIMARFALAAEDGTDLRQALETAAEVELAEVPWAAARRFWQARIADIADTLLAGEAERRARGRPLGVEVTGAREIPTLGFTLTARADRIDRSPAGTLAIYDYKSGTPPTKKQVSAFAKQLPLEASMAEAGGFTDIDPAPVGHLEFIGLNRAAATMRLDMEDQDITAIWAEFTRLIAAFADPGTAYPARARAEYIAYAGDYDHLARRGEWDDGDAAAVEDVG
ncbi:MAG: double-strand break repair protein AddB [Pseudomonadota bacterium]